MALACVSDEIHSLSLAIVGLSVQKSFLSGLAFLRPVLKRSVLVKPLRSISENAGKDSNEVVQKVMAMEAGMGFDANIGEYVDMIKSGIIDPLKVVKTALLNAVSVASMILTTEAVVTDIPEEKKEPAAPPMGGMDY